MRELLELLTISEDNISIVIDVLTFIGIPSLGGAAWWVIRRWWLARQPTDVNVIEVISRPTDLLPKLYSSEDNSSPLADHNIPYQRRREGRDIQVELRERLNKKKYLLIAGQTGYGKTREAGLLTQSLMLEGYLAVRIRAGWLDIPKELPKDLQGSHKRIVLLLDDLNHLFRYDYSSTDPRSEKLPLIGRVSYHDRLQKVLDHFERVYPGEVLVIATARNEKAQWKALGYNKKDKLWKRFSVFRLPAPDSDAIIQTLAAAADASGLPTQKEDLKGIAYSNQGAFKNVIQNLQRLKATGLVLSRENYIQTLDGSWRDGYNRHIENQPAVRFLYDGIDVLTQTKIILFIPLVKDAAKMVWGGNWIQRIIRQKKIQKAILYLLDEKVIPQQEGVFIPYDGQIEAKQNRVNWENYADLLVSALLWYADKNIRVLNESVYGFGEFLYDNKRIDDSIQLFRGYSSRKPNEVKAQSNLGMLLQNKGLMQEAEDAYHKAINIDPNFAMTYYNLGVLLQAQGRAQEAEEAFRLAIAKDPNHSNAYSYLGQLLKSQGRLQEADAVNRQAIEHNPENITAYYDLIRIKILEGETDNALDYLMKVTNKEDFSPAWAWRDPELENLRQDSRFEEIVGPNPKILDKSVNPPQ